MKKMNKGFTMLEVIVIIFIVSILLAFFAPRISDATRKTNDLVKAHENFYKIVEYYEAQV